MMVSGMVFVMFLYNMYMEGLLSTLTIWSISLNFALTFVVAFVLEAFIVGPIARGIAFKLPYDKSKRIYVILVVSTCMVIGMVLCMSVFGLIITILSSSLEGSLLDNYFVLIIRNFVVAYPAQLLVVGPLARWVLVTFIKDNTHSKIEYN